MQTNEVARAWALLPGLLSIGAERIDLVELGASAGLLLALDRYGYRYRAGEWGNGGRPLLAGDDRGGPPAGLLARPLEVEPAARDRPRAGRRRRPPRASACSRRSSGRTSSAGASGCTRRSPPSAPIRRSSSAATTSSFCPSVLRDRRPDALTVVMTSVSTVYLAEERYQTLVATLARAGRDAPLAWVSLEGVRNASDADGVVLELTAWPGGETRRLARVDYHAAWLEWLGA